MDASALSDFFSSQNLKDILQNPNTASMLGDIGSRLGQGQTTGQALGQAAMSNMNRQATQQANQALANSLLGGQSNGQTSNGSGLVSSFTDRLRSDPTGISLLGPKDDMSTANKITLSNDGISVDMPNPSRTGYATNMQLQDQPLESLGGLSGGTSGSSQLRGSDLPNFTQAPAIDLRGMEPAQVQALVGNLLQANQLRTQAQQAQTQATQPITLERMREQAADTPLKRALLQAQVKQAESASKANLAKALAAPGQRASQDALRQAQTQYYNALANKVTSGPALSAAQQLTADRLNRQNQEKAMLQIMAAKTAPNSQEYAQSLATSQNNNPESNIYYDIIPADPGIRGLPFDGTDFDIKPIELPINPKTGRQYTLGEIKLPMSDNGQQITWSALKKFADAQGVSMYSVLKQWGVVQ